MKIVDIVNEHDEIIGQAPIAECHRNPQLIHRVAHFTLVDGKNQRIFISQRSPHVHFDSGMWCFMGEHLVHKDLYPQAVFRGLRTELGLEGVEGIGEWGHTVFRQT